MRHKPPANGQRILGVGSADTKPLWWGFYAPRRRVPPRGKAYFIRMINARRQPGCLH